MRTFLLGLPAIMACATVSENLPPQRPLGREIKPIVEAADSRESGPLNLRKALALALAKNPALRVAAAEIKRQSGLAVEVGVAQNPEISVQLEDFGGSGPYAGTRGREATIQLSQLIELGGARWSRLQAGRHLQDAAAWRYEAQRLDILATTMSRFVAALAAQAAVDAAKEAAEAASAATQLVADSIEAGRSAPVELARARTHQAGYDLRLTSLRTRLAAAQGRLAEMWAGEPPVHQVIGNLEDVTAPPAYEGLAEALQQNPLRAAGLAEIASGQARVSSAKRERIPWIRLSGGYRDYTGDESAFVAGITAPLPIFDLNQGGVAVAEAESWQARNRLRAIENSQETELRAAYGELQAAYAQAVAYKSQILPDTQQAAQAIEEGYRLGKFGQLDLLTAQQAVFEARTNYAEALEEYHQAAAAIQRLTGEPLFRNEDLQ